MSNFSLNFWDDELLFALFTHGLFVVKQNLYQSFTAIYSDYSSPNGYNRVLFIPRRS